MSVHIFVNVLHVIFSLHHRIVNVRIVHREPSHHIGIDGHEFLQRRIFLLSRRRFILQQIVGKEGAPVRSCRYPRDSTPRRETEEVSKCPRLYSISDCQIGQPVLPVPNGAPPLCGPADLFLPAAAFPPERRALFLRILLSYECYACTACRSCSVISAHPLRISNPRGFFSEGRELPYHLLRQPSERKDRRSWRYR